MVERNLVVLFSSNISDKQVNFLSKQISKFDLFASLSFVTAQKLKNWVQTFSEYQRDSQPEESSNDWILFVKSPVDIFPRFFKTILEQANLEADPSVYFTDALNRNGKIVKLMDYSPERFRNEDLTGELVLLSANLFRGRTVEYVEHPALAFQNILFELSRSSVSFQHVSTVGYKELEEERFYFQQFGSDPVFKEIFQSHVDQSGGGIVYWDENLESYQSERMVMGEPLVSIVIPTRGLLDYSVDKSYLVQAIESIVSSSSYNNYEVVVVIDSGYNPFVVTRLKELLGNKLELVEWTKPFNFSQKMNLGVLHSQGEFVLLLNDDVKVISANWIESMLAIAQQDGIGMVGAMLYYEDDSIQHAGHAYLEGSPTHIGLGYSRRDSGPRGAFNLVREVSGVTAACALLKKEIFKEAGGFTPLLPGNFNDVDLCLKIGSLGYSIIWTPKAELYHYESKTRDAHVHYFELDIIERRWGQSLDDTRYWSSTN